MKIPKSCQSCTWGAARGEDDVRSQLLVRYCIFLCRSGFLVISPLYIPPTELSALSKIISKLIKETRRQHQTIKKKKKKNQDYNLKRWQSFSLTVWLVGLVETHQTSQTNLVFKRQFFGLVIKSSCNSVSNLDQQWEARQRGMTFQSCSSRVSKNHRRRPEGG